MGENGTIQSLVKGFEIIEVMSLRGGLTASELASELDMPISTSHNYLETLTKTGFVIREEDRIYRPSTKFLEIGERRRQRMPVVKVTAAELSNLAEETGEHVSLMIEENGLGVLIRLEKGENAIDIDAFHGVNMPLHTVAPGKAILSHLPHHRIEEILDRHGLEPMTKHTVTDRDRLFQQLEQIRDQGYAIDRGERMSGMTCIAVPVLDMSEQIRAAVCVCSPSHRVETGDYIDETLKALQRSANVIQVNLDYS